MQKALESRCCRHRKENGALAATHRMSDAFAPLACVAHLMGAQEMEKWKGKRRTQAGGEQASRRASIKHYIERALSIRGVHMRRKKRRRKAERRWMLEIETTQMKEKSLIYRSNCRHFNFFFDLCALSNCSQNIIFSPRKFVSARCSTSGLRVLFSSAAFVRMSPSVNNNCMRSHVLQTETAHKRPSSCLQRRRARAHTSTANFSHINFSWLC